MAGIRAGQRPLTGGAPVQTRAVRLSIVVSLLRHIRHVVARRLRTSPDGSALVSVLFAHPDCVVIDEVARHNAYLNDVSGNRWDLFIAGYQRRAGGPPTFDPAAFRALVDTMQREHRRALAHADGHDGTPWEFSETADLVSYMAYADGKQVREDWLSLRAVQLVDVNGSYLDMNARKITRVMSDWREEPPLLHRLAPGEAPQRIRLGILAPALAFLGAAVGSGVTGNAAYDLLKAMST